MLKSIVAVVGCYVLSVVLVFCTDPLLSLVFSMALVASCPTPTPLG